MGSRALLGQCFIQLVNGNQSCKYFSSSAALYKRRVLLPHYCTHLETKPERYPVNLYSDAPPPISERSNTMITIESDVNGVGIASGVPEEHIETRTVYIYQPTKNAMQSGTNNTNSWQISFDTRERWENPLMGWCSSGDPLQATRVNFPTMETAIQHCQNMGWEYFVQKPNRNDPKPRSYGSNFSWNKRTRVSTK